MISRILDTTLYAVIYLFIILLYPALFLFWWLYWLPSEVKAFIRKG